MTKPTPIETVKSEIHFSESQERMYAHKIANLWSLDYIEDGFLKNGVKFKEFVSARDEQIEILRKHQFEWRNQIAKWKSSLVNLESLDSD